MGPCGPPGGGVRATGVGSCILAGTSAEDGALGTVAQQPGGAGAAVKPKQDGRFDTGPRAMRAQHGLHDYVVAAQLRGEHVVGLRVAEASLDALIVQLPQLHAPTG